MRKLIIFFIGIFLMSLFVKCSNEDLNAEVNEDEAKESVSLTTEQLEKIEFNSDYDALSKSNEKNEKLASKEYINLIQERLKEIEVQQIRSTSLKSIGSNLVGVAKNGTCGQFRQITIKYDTQDSGNANKQVGYHADWSVTSAVAWMYFCEVPYEGFGNIGQDYALLRLSSDYIYPKGFDDGIRKIYHLKRFMDAEDSNPLGFVKLYKNGVEQSSSEMKLAFTPNTMDSGFKNLTLNFIWFPATEPALYTALPNLGFDYGVFGTVSLPGNTTEDQGYIYTDDEDSDNSNYMEVTSIDKYGNIITQNILDQTNFNNILYVSGNTRFYFTKVKAN